MREAFYLLLWFQTCLAAEKVVSIYQPSSEWRRFQLDAIDTSSGANQTLRMGNTPVGYLYATATFKNLGYYCFQYFDYARNMSNYKLFGVDFKSSTIRI